MSAYNLIRFVPGYVCIGGVNGDNPKLRVNNNNAFVQVFYHLGGKTKPSLGLFAHEIPWPKHAREPKSKQASRCLPIIAT